MKRFRSAPLSRAEPQASEPSALYAARLRGMLNRQKQRAKEGRKDATAQGDVCSVLPASLVMRLALVRDPSDQWQMRNSGSDSELHGTLRRTAIHERPIVNPNEGKREIPSVCLRWLSRVATASGRG